MVHQQLNRLFEERDAAVGDAVFGHYDLVAGDTPLAPIQRVAVFTEAFLPKVDGVTKTTYLTVRYLQETGREVIVFAPDPSVPMVGTSPVYAMPAFSLPSAVETRVALPGTGIWPRIRDFQPDLIHLASPALMSVEGMSAARTLNIPVVANYQTDLPGYAEHYGANVLARPVRDWLRYIHNGCHVNLVPSATIQQELRKHGYKRLFIWGRGVNIDRFHPVKQDPTMRTRLLAGRDPASLLVIYVGRLANEKCVDLLRQVADVPGVALTIIGDGQRREDLQTLFAGTGTHFTGYLFGDDLSAAFASADAFFFAGAQETFGQVVQEAMASGLPVVVTERGSVGDLVQPGKTGFVVHHTPEAFAAAARLLESDRAFTAWMGRQARAFAETRPWTAIMSQLERYYQHAYDMNLRFKSLFGRTHYHATAAPRGLAIAAGTFIAANLWKR